MDFASVANSADRVAFNFAFDMLEGLSREEMLDWLKGEFDELLMHGFEPLLEDGGFERNNAEILLEYLEKTKAEMSPGLQFEVEAVGDPVRRKVICESVSAICE